MNRGLVLRPIVAATAITEEKLMELIVGAVAEVGAGVYSAGGGTGGGDGGRVIKEKGFNDVMKLTKGQDQYTEWSYDFKVALGRQNPEMKRTLEMIEGYPEEIKTKRVRSWIRRGRTR